MSARPPSRQAPRANPVQDQSAASVSQERRGSLRWVRDVLSRSIRLEQGRTSSTAATTDTRRGDVANTPPSLLMQQRAELGARLLVHDPATQPVRHLFVVHDELRIKGWPGVEALPLKVIRRAQREAEILSSDEPSPLLTTIIDGLRELQVAADTPAAPEPLEEEWETLQVPEVSDTNFDEYELMERSWAGTVPAGLELPGRGI